jgi:aspartate oxidase
MVLALGAKWAILVKRLTMMCIHQVLATNNEKVSDEIHEENHLRPVKDWERLKEVIWSMMGCFRASVHVARLDERFHQFPRLWPPIPARD